MQDKLVEVTTVFAIVISALAYLAIRAWRGRVIGHSKLVGSLPASFEIARPDVFDGHYVATTPEAKPLERLVGAGLAHRGRAVVRIGDEGIEIQRVGEATLYIPAGKVRGVTAESAAIDRAVEPGGLTAIRWANNGVELETYLRMESVTAHRAIASQFSNQTSKEQR